MTEPAAAEARSHHIVAIATRMSHHFPLLAVQLEDGGQLAADGGGGGRAGGEGLGARAHGGLDSQARVLVGLLRVGDVLQAWGGGGGGRKREREYEERER